VESVYNVPPQYRGIYGGEFRQKSHAKASRVEARERRRHGTRIFQPCTTHNSGKVVSGKKRRPPPPVSYLTGAPVTRETREQLGAIRKEHRIRVRGNETERGPRRGH
jgi:hypothetical protein